MSKTAGKKKIANNLGKDTYIVEKILEHKAEDGKILYHLKWKDYADSYNSWEPEENLSGNILLELYKQAEKEKADGKNVNQDKESSTDQETGQNDKASAAVKNVVTETNALEADFNALVLSTNEDGYEAEKIYGATSVNGERHFFIKWAGLNDGDLVPASKANKKWPSKVIEYYEHHLLMEK